MAIKSERMEWTRHAVCMGAGKNPYRSLIEQIKGKRRLGRPRCRCEDNIKFDLNAIRGEGGNGFIWIKTVTCAELS
jgi:hypothetical protein